MRTHLPLSFGQKRGALAALLALAAAANPASVQSQPGPPPGVQGPPPGVQGPPPGVQGAPPRGSGATAQLGPPPPLPLTPAQKLVADLPPPGPGGLPPRPPLAPDAPMPSADPRDFQGTWHHDLPLEFRAQKDMYGGPAPYTMEGAKVISRRVLSLRDGKPFVNASATCRPPGPQWQMDLNFPFQIMQSKDQIAFIFEEYHGRWNISLDPQRMPQPSQKSYQGSSVGHWDGNTLVVETKDFKQPIWMDVDGTPLSANGKLIQRIRKVSDGGHVPYLEVVTTIVDPVLYTKPWSIVRSFAWDPNLALFNEYNCEEQIGDPSVKADAGLVPEPKN